jgi:DNA relaxase NicK
MEFIKPKNKKASPVDWQISEKTQNIIKFYAEYTEYTESEVVDLLLQNIKKDEAFINWVEQKRNNKRLLKLMGLDVLKEA